MRYEDCRVNDMITNSKGDVLIIAGFIDIYEDDFYSVECEAILNNNKDRRIPLTHYSLEQMVVFYREMIAFVVREKMEENPRKAQIYAQDLIAKHIITYDVNTLAYTIVSNRELESLEYRILKIRKE